MEEDKQGGDEVEPNVIGNAEDEEEEGNMEGLVMEPAHQMQQMQLVPLRDISNQFDAQKRRHMRTRRNLKESPFMSHAVELTADALVGRASEIE